MDDDGPVGGAKGGIDPARVDALVVRRDEARASKDWKAADMVRDVLAALGVRLEDAPGGTRWVIEE
jgi:cysteinyl-tRNA synthetase